MTNEIENGMDVQAINQAVKKFNEDFKASLVEAQGVVVEANESRDAQAYRFAAGLFDLAKLLKPETPSVELIKFLNARGQKTVADGDNPYGPFVKAVCAVKNGDDWKFNPKQASFAKYANIVRQLIEDDKQGLIENGVVAYIRDFEYGDRSKLAALEAKDRALRPNESQVKRVEKVRDLGLKAAPVLTIDADFAQETGSVISMWGVINDDGQLEVMAATLANNQRDSLYYKLGMELKKAA